MMLVLNVGLFFLSFLIYDYGGTRVPATTRHLTPLVLFQIPLAVHLVVAGRTVLAGITREKGGGWIGYLVFLTGFAFAWPILFATVIFQLARP